MGQQTILGLTGGDGGGVGGADPFDFFDPFLESLEPPFFEPFDFAMEFQPFSFFLAACSPTDDSGSRCNANNLIDFS